MGAAATHQHLVNHARRRHVGTAPVDGGPRGGVLPHVTTDDGFVAMPPGAINPHAHQQLIAGAALNRYAEGIGKNLSD